MRFLDWRCNGKGAHDKRLLLVNPASCLDVSNTGQIKFKLIEFVQCQDQLNH